MNKETSMRKTLLPTVGVLAASLLSPLAIAADHGDGTPATLNQPDGSSDITDVFAWMTSDGTKMNLVMDVFPGAMTASKFSDAVKYAFHTASGAAFGATTNRVNVICTFDAAQVVSCWVVDVATVTTLDYVTGDASAPAGITSADGKVKVFAGLRDDPFFFNLAGFRRTAQTVAMAAAGGTILFDVAGCPTNVGPLASTIAAELGQGCDGAAAFDFFKTPAPGDNPPGCTNVGLTGNILGLVVQVDKSLVTQGGAIVSVWGSTNK